MPTPVPPCPRCGGPMWDNRANKTSEKGPDFKCKNKACLDEKGFVTAVWVKPTRPPAAPAPTKSQVPFNPPGVKDADLPELPRAPGDDKTEKIDSLIKTYIYVTAKLVPELDKVYGEAEIGLSPEAAQAAVATVVIQAGRTGLL